MLFAYCHSNDISRMISTKARGSIAGSALKPLFTGKIELMSRRIVRALDLVRDAGLIAAYEARHAPGAVPADVVRDLRDRGFQEMEIWRVADRLVMIAEVAGNFPRPSDPSLQAAVDAWERAMDEFQRPFAEGPKWAEMTRIFTLSEQ